MKTKDIFIIGGLVLVVVAAMSIGAWYAARQLTQGVLAGLLLAACALLPVAGGIGYWLGATEARGTLKGLDLGVSKIFGTSVRATRRRGYMGQVAQYANPAYAAPQIIALPEVEFDQVQDASVVDL